MNLAESGLLPEPCGSIPRGVQQILAWHAEQKRLQAMLGVWPSDHEVYVVLRDHPQGLTARELGEMVGRDAYLVAGALRRLRDKGWTVGHPGPHGKAKLTWFAVDAPK